MMRLIFSSGKAQGMCRASLSVAAEQRGRNENMPGSTRECTGMILKDLRPKPFLAGAPRRCEACKQGFTLDKPKRPSKSGTQAA
jgi:hypothetical protein